MNGKYEIEYVADGNYIRVRPLAPLTRDLILQYSVAADEMCLKVGCKGYLFDLRGMSNVNDTVDNYDFVYRDMQAMDLSRSAGSAVLIDPTDESHDFPVVLLRNAGYNIRMFTDEQEAVDWLRGNL